MSLILDALNRTREDKDSVPNLTTHHAVVKMASGKRQYLPWAAIAVLLVSIVWLAMGQFSAAPEPDAGTDTGTLVPVTQVPQTITATARADSTASVQEGAAEVPVVQPVVESQKLEPVTVTVTDTLADSPPGPELAPLAVEAEIVTSPEAVESIAVAQLYQNRDLADDAALRGRTSPAALELYAKSGVEEPIDIAEVLKSAREELKDASLESHPVPLLATLSQQTKDSIPTLYYQRHDYSSNVAISTVVLNGDTLRVGGSLGQGIKVEEILPDSVVLSYQGIQFRLRALNSWVNL